MDDTLFDALEALAPEPDAPPYEWAKALRRANELLDAAPELVIDAALVDLRQAAEDTIFLARVALLVAARAMPLPAALAHHAMSRALQTAERGTRETFEALEIARCAYLACRDEDVSTHYGRLLATYANALIPIDGEEALRLVNQAIENLAGQDTLQGVAWLIKNDVLFDNQRPHEALDAARQGLALLEPLLPTTKVHVGKLYRNIGSIYQDFFDDFAEAERGFARAAPLLADSTGALASLMLMWGTLATKQGLFYEAARYFSEARRLYSPDDHADHALLAFYEAELAMRMHDRAFAQKKLADAFAEFDEQINHREFAEALLLHASITTNLTQALAAIDRALELFHAHGNNYGVAQALYQRARQLFTDKKTADALAALDEAETLFRQQGRDQALLDARLLREFNREPLDPAALDALYEQAEGFQDAATQAAIQQVLGEYYEREQRTDDARQAYDRAITALDRARLQLRIGGQVARFQERYRKAFQRAQALAAGDERAVWRYAERGRAPALLDRMANAPAAADNADPRWRRLARLRHDLQRAYAEQQSERSAIRKAYAPKNADRIRELHAAFTALRNELAASGDTASWNLGEIATPDTICSLIDPNTVLVHYLAVGSAGAASRQELWALVLSQDEFTLIGPGQPLANTKDLRRLREALESEPFGQKGSKPPCHRLYQHFIAPIEDLLAPYSELICVLPDEEAWMQGLPIHAAFDGRRYLVERFAVSYAPSASVFARCQQRPVVAGSSFVAGYGPDLEAGLLKELKAVGHLLGCPNPLSTGLEPEALCRALEAATLAHLSCHGSAADGYDAMFAHLLIGERQRVYAHDLAQLHMHADLVTLSACESGQNEDAHQGMVGSLLAAGSRSVLASLWEADNKTTTMLMQAFYTAALGPNAPSRAQALAHAQRSLLADQSYGEPWFWAPFKLTGACGPLGEDISGR